VLGVSTEKRAGPENNFWHEVRNGRTSWVAYRRREDSSAMGLGMRELAPVIAKKRENCFKKEFSCDGLGGKL